MSKRDEQRMAKLVKKHAGAPKSRKIDKSAQYDETLRGRPPEQDPETKRLFKEMRERDF